jgi:hypothetical protein
MRAQRSLASTLLGQRVKTLGQLVEQITLAENLRLEAAQDLYQTVNLASGGGSGRLKVLFHAQARKERHHHTSQVIYRPLRLFRLDILGNELL